MASNPERLRKAGHYEILGETLAKFEFFEEGWNPYSRFLDIDKVDLILRRKVKGVSQFREVQVKFGKLYRITEGRWDFPLFDLSSFRMFKDGEFKNADPRLFVAYVLSEDGDYTKDFFIFPAREFASIIRKAPLVSEKNPRRRVLISRRQRDANRWLMRQLSTRFDSITRATCVDVSEYRRNVAILNGPSKLKRRRVG